MSAEEVFSKIQNNRSFICGITVSEGECSLYPEFLTELFGLARQEGLTCQNADILPGAGRNSDLFSKRQV